VAFDTLLLHLTPSIGRDKWHFIALTYDMSFTIHTPEKSLLPMVCKCRIKFDLHISAIEEVGIARRALMQMYSNIANIFISYLITSLLMPPGSISPTMSCITFRLPSTVTVSTILMIQWVLTYLHRSPLVNKTKDLATNDSQAHGFPQKKSELAL
jgi:hypothetical protein